MHTSSIDLAIQEELGGKQTIWKTKENAQNGSVLRVNDFRQTQF